MPSLFEHSVAEPRKGQILLIKLIQSNSFLNGPEFTCVWLVGLCTIKSVLYYISHQVRKMNSSPIKNIGKNLCFVSSAALCFKVRAYQVMCHTSKNQGVFLDIKELGQIVHQRAVRCTYTSKLQCMYYISISTYPLFRRYTYIHMYLGAMHRF